MDRHSALEVPVMKEFLPSSPINNLSNRAIFDTVIPRPSLNPVLYPTTGSLDNIIYWLGEG